MIVPIKGSVYGRIVLLVETLCNVLSLIILVMLFVNVILATMVLHAHRINLHNKVECNLVMN